MAESIYLTQLAHAAVQLESLPRADGGWGLTPTSVSSIVNTAEVGVVLKAAGRGGDIGRRVVDYIGVAIPMYCRPEPTFPGEHFGRGERTRFISFGLEGLTTYPDELFASEPAMGAIAFSLRFLEGAQVNGGWPETRGGLVDSIHQTSKVVASLVRLILADSSVERLTPEQRRSAELLAVAGGRRLLALQREDGSWPSGPGASELSATKTALATTALGYLAHISDLKGMDYAREDGARWLVSNLKKWDGQTEEATDEQGTHWVHLAYAECVRGVLAGSSETPGPLKSVFARLARLWSTRESLWTEPGRPEGKATIRAAYHTVMAFESARSDSILVLPKKLPPRVGTVIGDVRGISILEQGFTILGAHARAEVSLQPGPMVTLAALAAGSGASTTQELANATGKSVASIHQDVRSINTRAATESYDAVPRLIRSIRRERRYYYELSVPVLHQ